MQFIGQSLLAHHFFYGTVRIFTLSDIVSQAVFYNRPPLSHEAYFKIRDRPPLSHAEGIFGSSAGILSYEGKFYSSSTHKGNATHLTCM